MCVCVYVCMCVCVYMRKYVFGVCVYTYMCVIVVFIFPSYYICPSLFDLFHMVLHGWLTGGGWWMGLMQLKMEDFRKPMLIRPQASFGSDFDNSNVPFVPKIRVKTHAIIPLGEAPVRLSSDGGLGSLLVSYSHLA